LNICIELGVPESNGRPLKIGTLSRTYVEFQVKDLELGIKRSPLDFHTIVSLVILIILL